MYKPLGKGDIVISKLGHDTGRIYVVLDNQLNEFITVVDGKIRPLSKPKIKRAKHVRLMSKAEGPLETVTDTEIKRIIKLWRENAERRGYRS